MGIRRCRQHRARSAIVSVSPWAMPARSASSVVGSRPRSVNPGPSAAFNDVSRLEPEWTRFARDSGSLRTALAQRARQPISGAPPGRARAVGGRDTPPSHGLRRASSKARSVHEPAVVRTLHTTEPRGPALGRHGVDRRRGSRVFRAPRAVAVRVALAWSAGPPGRRRSMTLSSPRLLERTMSRGARSAPRSS